MAETYYERLGVPSDATAEEIERAYRERLKETHPDVSDDPRAEADTRALIEARDVLTDEMERGRYDRLGHDRYVDYHDSFVEPSDGDVAAADPHQSDTADSTHETGQGGWNSDRATGGWSADDRATEDRNTGDRTASRGGDATSTGSHRQRRHAQNEQTRATWNATGQQGAGAGDAGSSTGESYAREWHAWNTGSPHRVHPTDPSTIGNRLYPPGPSLVLLVTAFAVYPVVLWATVTPSFPLTINLVVGLCLLGIVAYLQSMPGVGVVVFGAWTVLLPLALVLGFGLPPVSLPVFVAIGGTALPLGLSVLTRAVLRW